MKIPDNGMFLCNSLNEGNVMVYSRLNELFHEWKGGHNELAVKYVISGEERYVINKKTQIVSEGCFMLVNKGQGHQVTLPYTTAPIQGLCMSLSSVVLNDVLYTHTSSDASLLENPQQKEIRHFDFFEGIYRPEDLLNQYIFKIVESLDRETGQVPLDSCSLFYGLAEHLLLSQSLIRKKIQLINAQQYNTRKELFRRIHEAKQIIDQHPGAVLNITSLAASVAMSEFHFFRTFKQVFGTSPHRYQLRRKMEDASKMLIGSKKSVTDIAFLFGFADAAGFSKSFRKMFGVSPAAFRK